MIKSKPLSAYQETLGMIYFARMLDKIRLHAASLLHEDFCDNLGSGFDARCTDFLRINYQDLTTRVCQGSSNEEILQWCFNRGRHLSDGDIFIWNQFLKKVGWKDPVTEILSRRKQASGFEAHPEIETMLEYFEYDEGRKSTSPNNAPN